MRIRPDDLPFETHEEMAISRKLTRILRREIGHYVKRSSGAMGPGMKCDTAGWVDIIKIIECQYVWTSKEDRDVEKFDRRDRYTHHLAYDRFCALVKIGCVNAKKMGQKRWQILRHTMTFKEYMNEDTHDYGFLAKHEWTDRDIRIATQNCSMMWVRPVAIRATCGHSIVDESVPLDPELIAYPNAGEHLTGHHDMFPYHKVQQHFIHHLPWTTSRRRPW